ncbi:hypothetical protein AGRA3207_007305 [Actinomadura graeca]|uniref:Integral membrane protein n=1 Tax=Actinomadura graeca TaxID=2750812 RepID=A0ABX8R736_9ACTN|nr:hypothetical protein [Actinomadura graeca]QXJ25762.1 hypothetical protein AGRA3207_007305 [Actinomadura graeca]
MAAPLLAGFSVALVGVAAADHDKLRWPGPVLLALSIAVVALVASVQAGFHARSFFYSAADVVDWWSEEEVAVPERTTHLQEEQKAHFGRWRSWSTRACVTYDIGITALAIAVTLVLPPPPGTHSGEWFRWLACGVVAAGTLGELIWISSYPARGLWRRWVILRNPQPRDGDRRVRRDREADGSAEAGRERA